MSHAVGAVGREILAKATLNPDFLISEARFARFTLLKKNRQFARGSVLSVATAKTIRRFFSTASVLPHFRLYALLALSA